MRELFGGYDPGGKEDPAAFVVVERLRVESLLRVVFIKTYLKDNSRRARSEEDDDKLYTRFTVEIAEIHKKIKLRKLLVDQTGLGRPIIEHCRELNLPAEGMTLTARSKEELLSNLKILLEQKKIILPQGSLDLLANLNCIQWEPSRTGGSLFSHPRGTHDDLAYALALACYAASGKSPRIVMMKREEPENSRRWRSS